MSLPGEKRLILRGSLCVAQSIFCEELATKQSPTNKELATKQAPRKVAAFTLIEVLIALAILAIALTAIIYSVASSVRDTAHLQDKLAAHWVAMNILTSSQVGLIQLPTEVDQTQTGTSNMLNQKWSWTLGIDQPSLPKGALFARVYVRVDKFGTKDSFAYLRGFDQLVSSLTMNVAPDNPNGGGGQ